MNIIKLATVHSVLLPGAELKNIAHWGTELSAPTFSFNDIFEGVVVERGEERVVVPWTNVRFVEIEPNTPLGVATQEELTQAEAEAIVEEVAEAELQKAREGRIARRRKVKVKADAH